MGTDWNGIWPHQPVSWYFTKLGLQVAEKVCKNVRLFYGRLMISAFAPRWLHFEQSVFENPWLLSHAQSVKLQKDLFAWQQMLKGKVCSSFYVTVNGLLASSLHSQTFYVHVWCASHWHSCSIIFSHSQLDQKMWLGSFRSADDSSFP